MRPTISRMISHQARNSGKESEQFFGHQAGCAAKKKALRGVPDGVHAGCGRAGHMGNAAVTFRLFTLMMVMTGVCVALATFKIADQHPNGAVLISLVLSLLIGLIALRPRADRSGR